MLWTILALKHWSWKVVDQGIRRTCYVYLVLAGRPWGNFISLHWGNQFLFFVLTIHQFIIFRVLYLLEKLRYPVLYKLWCWHVNMWWGSEAGTRAQNQRKIELTSNKLAKENTPRRGGRLRIWIFSLDPDSSWKKSDQILPVFNDQTYNILYWI